MRLQVFYLIYLCVTANTTILVKNVCVQKVDQQSLESLLGS